MDLTDLFGTAEPTQKKGGRTARIMTRAEIMAYANEDSDDDIVWEDDAGAIDHVLQGRTIEGDENRVLQAMTDVGRKKNALRLPVEAGTRVTFLANLGSVMAYDDIPGDGTLGTVVTVRSASGDITAFQGRVHVLWDDGRFRAIYAEHLRKAKVQGAPETVVRRVACGDLSSFFEPILNKTASADTDLIHKATKDLWSFKRQGEEYVVERLFTEDGNPLKV